MKGGATHKWQVGMLTGQGDGVSLPAFVMRGDTTHTNKDVRR